MTDYAVLDVSNYDCVQKGNYAIIREDKIKYYNLCECYDNYGNPIGCYEAGCYRNIYF